MRLRNLLPLLAGIFVLLTSTAIRASTITGTVKGPDGSAFPGAFVEAQNMKTKITVAVLSDTGGHYRIEGLAPGQYRILLRAIGYRTDPRTVVDLDGGSERDIRFRIANGTVRWSDISLYQGKQLFPPGPGKDILLSETCAICHSFQSRMASVTRDADGWADRVEYMRTAMRYVLATRLNDEQSATLSSYITSLFGPDSVLPKSPTGDARLSGYGAAVQQRSFEYRVRGIRYAWSEPHAVQCCSRQEWLSVDTELRSGQQNHAA